MKIGEAASASAVSAKMIRYYERIGLIEIAERTDGGYRTYSGGDVNTLRFLRRARDLGFSVAEMRELLALWRDRERASAEVRRVALAHIAAMEAKVAEMKEVIGTLRHLADNCDGDDRPNCPIIDDLASSRPPPAKPGRPRPAARFGAHR